MTAAIAASISSLIDSYCAFRSTNGMFMVVLKCLHRMHPLGSDRVESDGIQCERGYD